jgi:hypothetical protein
MKNEDIPQNNTIRITKQSLCQSSVKNNFSLEKNINAYRILSIILSGNFFPLTSHFLSKYSTPRPGDMAQVVEYLPSEHQACLNWNLNSSTAQKHNHTIFLFCLSTLLPATGLQNLLFTFI